MCNNIGYIILKDLWKDELKITNKTNEISVNLPIQGGFRGLYNLSFGEYIIENHNIQLKLNLTNDYSVQVWQLDSSAGIWIEIKEEDDDFGYHNLAKSGAMNKNLINLKQTEPHLFDNKQ